MSIFFNIEGIRGEVTAIGHEDWLEGTSLTWNVGRAISSVVGTSADREASKPSISEVTITRMMDAATPLLFTDACVGKGKLVKIDLTTIGTDNINSYMKYELSECMLSNYAVSCDLDERPYETISLSFTKLTMKYQPYDSSGRPTSPIPAGYDMAMGSKV